MIPASSSWSRLPADFLVAPSGLSVGMIALAPDRVGLRDFEAFLAPAPDVAVFSTRVPLAEVVTPASLSAMRGHLAEAARRLVPGSPLDAIAFSCTSGTVAIGIEAVRQAIGEARPGVPVHTPIEAGVKALKTLGASRIALLAPYLEPAGDLIADYFATQEIEALSRTTFALDGDRQMNAVSPACLIAAGRQCLAATPRAQALFISCTGLATADVVEAIEQAAGLPVVTSNQALAWDVLRSCGVTKTFEARGRLFR